jgi:hypothetical protein
MSDHLAHYQFSVEKLLELYSSAPEASDEAAWRLWEKQQEEVFQRMRYFQSRCDQQEISRISCKILEKKLLIAHQELVARVNHSSLSLHAERMSAQLSQKRLQAFRSSSRTLSPGEELDQKL